MKKWLLLILLTVSVLIVFDYTTPRPNGEHIEVTIVSVADAPRGNGWRHIAVKMPEGHSDRELMIETLAPFFYQPDYTAWLGVNERYLFSDTYDFISPPAK